MKKLFFICTILWLSVCCRKPDFYSLGGNETFNGIALLNDNYSNNDIYTPAKQLTVYLRHINDPLSYLYTTKTDNSGHFSFSGIDKKVNYLIDAVHETEQIQYSGQVSFGPDKPHRKSGKDSLVLQIDQNLQNGIHLTVKDEMGGYIPNAAVWVFKSQVLFNSDTSKGATFVMTTNEYGIANKYNISPGEYFFRTKNYSGNLVLVDEQKKSISNRGIGEVTLTVKQVPAAGYGNGIDLTITNESGNVVNNATAYFYNDYEIYLQDSGTFEKSSFRLYSGIDGRVTNYVINPATYFVWARKVVAATDTLNSSQQFSIIVNTTISQGHITIK